MNTKLDQLSPIQKSAYALKKLRAKLDKLEKKQSEPIAIIGMSCRFPGASNCNDYWRLLHDGKNAVTEIPGDRWPINDYYDPDASAPGKMNTKWGGFLSQIDMFDADFFGISLREAKKMDPQQRIMLEITWEALENAGLSPKKLIESQTGIYLGFNQIDYGLMQLKSDSKNLDHYTTTGNGYCFGAGRIAYTFGFHGPAITIDTACSSSLVALHQACNGLRSDDCNMAIAGGIQLNILPSFHILLSQTHTLSPSGACKTFDADADGLVLGEGCGVVVLKRLSDALSSNDHILALILGSGVNHGGPASGITVPNEIAQEKVIRKALKKARVEPSDIHFIETHGTATAIGDPIEFNAIDSIFGDRPGNDPLILGAVKTNIGHLDAASGIAGLIKTVLSLQHNEIPPNLHFRNPSPKIDWTKGNIKVASEKIDWPRGEKRRIAGISSFGISGTNSHAIIEEPPESIEEQDDTFKRPIHIFTLSAKNEKALHELVRAYCEYLHSNPKEKIENLCYTANTGRDHFDHRICVLTNSISQLHEKLKAFLNGNDVKGLFSKEQKTRHLNITFYFPEENEQFIGMGSQLYKTQPLFKKRIDQCHSILKETYNISLNSILYNENDQLDFNHIKLAAFSIEFALSELWQSLGIKPSSVMGHGVGEIVASCVAGKFTLEQAIALIQNDKQPDNISAAHMKILSGKKSDAEFLQTIINQKSKYIIDMGSKSPILTEKTSEINYLSSIDTQQNEWETLLKNVSQLYLEGSDIDWESFDMGVNRKRVQLPSYRFQRKSYWVNKDMIDTIPVDGKESLMAEKKEPIDFNTAQSDSKPDQHIDKKLNNDRPSNTVLSRIMAQQLKVASDSMAKVVSQQLNFLSNSRMKQTQPGITIIKEEVRNEIINDSEINHQVDIEIKKEKKVEKLSKDTMKIEFGNSLDGFEHHLVLLSGRTEEELENETKKLIKNLKSDNLIEIQKILNELRKKQAFNHRRMLVCQNKEDCLETLENKDSKSVYTSICRKADRPIAFLFPGVGDHYINMSKKLYDTAPVYRKEFDKCCEILLPHLEQDLRDVLFVKPEQDEPETSKGGLDFRRMLQGGPVDKNTQKLNIPVFSHTGVFVVNYSLAKLWISWGIKPQATIGYSIGEYVSACLSEVISLEDVLPFIAKRAKMIQDLPEGAMLAVPLSEKEVLPHLDESHSIAILSTDSQCVIAGSPESIDNLEKTLTLQDILFRRLQNTHAVHSKLMEPLREPLTKMIRNLNLNPPLIPYLSNVTGTWINEAHATDPHYWAQHTCQTARFVDGIGELLQTPDRIMLEVGPGQSLGSFVYQHSGFGNSQNCIVFPSLKTMYDGLADDAFLQNTLGKLWLAGVEYNTK
ncbi:polyketide synthase [Candidatus Magnetomorum sp. HK-1]|nr:polyketide synthase [Candidatus Magnetomorum sp. HK-1]